MGTDTHRHRQLTILGAVVLGWALAYGSLRLAWVLGERPRLPPTGDDLLAFSDWGIVVLTGLAAVLGVALGAGAGTHRGREVLRPLRIPMTIIGIGTGVLLIAAAAPFVLDLVALIFPGIGIPGSAAAFGTRFAVLAGAALLLRLTVLAERELRGACPGCGRAAWPARVPGSTPRSTSGSTQRSTQRSTQARPDPADGPVPAPGWVKLAAYLGVAGLVVRELAQFVVGFGPEGNPLAGNDPTAGVAFLIAITLAGTVLPLAMVQRWGQRWPFWVPWLAGRRIPRWLPLGPAFGVSGALLAYFGVGAIQLVLDVSGSAGVASGYGSAFLGIAIGAYLVWGVGLGIAAVSYFFRTRPLCDRCGR